MKPNTIKGDELYVRCTNCGDSIHQDHAHLAINLTSGLFNCLRCHWHGKVNASLLLTLQVTDFPALDYHTSSPMPEVLRGAGTERASALPRYHASTGGDIFYSWWGSEHVGYYLRSPTAKMLWGFSGMAWAAAPEPLTSTPDTPLRFVEGPYDVLGPQDVCFFGIPSLNKIKNFFKGHFFVLVPDGDLWTDQARFSILRANINTLVRENGGFMGVEFLPQATDPDDRGKTQFIPLQYFKESPWQNTSLSSKARQELASLL